MHIGFELEFASEYNRKELQIDLSRILGPIKWISKTKRRRSSVKNYPKYYYSFYIDGTIESDYADQFEHELVTKVFGLKIGLKKLNVILDWMKEINVTTNKSTGLHFNISYKNIGYLDKRKLVEIVNEPKILKIFDRINNEFVRPHDLKTEFNLRDKARAISFLRPHYVEFRMIGGKNYHLKKELIQNIILQCVDALKASTNI